MSPERNLVVDSYHYSYRFNVPYPFPEKRIIYHLKEKDYNEYQDPGRMFFSRSGAPISMTVLQKDENEIHYNAREGVISIEGFEIEDINKDFAMLTKIITESLKIDISQIMYSEIIARIRVECNNPAIKTINSLVNFTNEELIQDIEDDAITYSFAICPKNAEESYKDLTTLLEWYHIRVVPFVPNPKYIVFDIVYRNKDIKKVQAFSGEMIERLIRFIDRLEGE